VDPCSRLTDTEWLHKANTLLMFNTAAKSFTATAGVLADVTVVYRVDTLLRRLERLIVNRVTARNAGHWVFRFVAANMATVLAIIAMRGKSK
jgi:hypothetical protein